MFEQPIVAFQPGQGFSLVGVDIIIDDNEFQGVHIAAKNLCKDFTNVVSQGGNVVLATAARQANSRSCIIVGSLSNSTTIQQLEVDKKINTSHLAGKWESWMTMCVSSPLTGYDNGLVIVGSDKRGAIFGIYSLSEQIGVSP